jgi:hypothetical protein
MCDLADEGKGKSARRMVPPDEARRRQRRWGVPGPRPREATQAKGAALTDLIFGCAVAHDEQQRVGVGPVQELVSVARTKRKARAHPSA